MTKGHPALYFNFEYKKIEKKVNSSFNKTKQKTKTLIGFHYRCLPPKVNAADIPHATSKSQNMS
jgi:hypothetical protein